MIIRKVLRWLAEPGARHWGAVWGWSYIILAWLGWLLPGPYDVYRAFVDWTTDTLGTEPYGLGHVAILVFMHTPWLLFGWAGRKALFTYADHSWCGRIPFPRPWVRRWTGGYEWRIDPETGLGEWVE